MMLMAIIPSYTSYIYADELKSFQDKELKNFFSDYVRDEKEVKDLGINVGFNKYTTWYAYERFYSTIDKRFLSKDPVVGSIYEPSRVNSYIYAGNNPLINVDRDGRSFACEITNGRYFKKAAELLGKISDVANKVGNVVRPIVAPIEKAHNAINELPTWKKLVIGGVGAAIAVATGMGLANVALKMAGSALGGATFGALTYGVQSLVTGHFDKTEMLNYTLDGAADMFMVSGVALGAVGLVKHVRNNNVLKLEYGELSVSDDGYINGKISEVSVGDDESVSIRKSAHAEIRSGQGRNVNTAINDINKSSPSKIYLQDDGRIVIKGDKGRVHILESDGEIVTTMNKVTNFDSRVLSGRYRPMTESERVEFVNKFDRYLGKSWNEYRGLV